MAASGESVVGQLKDLANTTVRNVGVPEQWLSVAAGLAAGWYALRRGRRTSVPRSITRSIKWGWLTVGGLLLARGVVGHCALYQALGLDSRSRSDDNERAGVHLGHSVTVHRPVEAMYQFWREVENWPHVMPHIQSVTKSGHNRFHCSTKGPTGATVTWDAAITDDRPNEQISWQSLSTSGGTNRGTVRFRPVDGGTEVRMTLHYDPRGGPVGVMTSKVLGDDPAHRIVEQLETFKRLMDQAMKQTEGMASVEGAALR